MVHRAVWGHLQQGAKTDDGSICSLKRSLREKAEFWLSPGHFAPEKGELVSGRNVRGLRLCLPLFHEYACLFTLSFPQDLNLRVVTYTRLRPDKMDMRRKQYEDIYSSNTFLLAH